WLPRGHDALLHWSRPDGRIAFGSRWTWPIDKEISPMMRLGYVVATTCLLTSSLAGQASAPPPAVGTWDLTLTAPDGRPLPSWLEVHVSGNGVLVGRFQGVVGSVRPISRLTYANDTLRFSI